MKPSKTIINLRAAETNIRQAAPHLPTPSYTVEQKVAGDTARTEAKQRMADRIKVEFDDRMESAALKAQAEEKDELWLEEELHRILSEMTDLMQQNDARWEGVHPFVSCRGRRLPRFVSDVRGGDPRRRGRVYLRDDHPAVAQLHAIGTAEESTARETFDLMVGRWRTPNTWTARSSPTTRPCGARSENRFPTTPESVLAQFADVFAKEGSR